MSKGALRFETAGGPLAVQADAVIFAMGGGSWPKLGSDGAWVSALRRSVPFRSLRYDRPIAVSTWNGANTFAAKFAGHPVKTVGVVAKSPSGSRHASHGRICVLPETGVEGGVIYAVAPYLRDEIQATGRGTLRLDLAPDRELPRLIKDLSQPRGKKTMATHLQRRAHIEGVKSGCFEKSFRKKILPIRPVWQQRSNRCRSRSSAPRPLAEAISTAGGVGFEALDSRLMVRSLPGVFCAGEMLDWEAPTGGYLLTACFASGRVAGAGAVAWLTERAGHAR